MGLLVEIVFLLRKNMLRAGIEPWTPRLRNIFIPLNLSLGYRVVAEQAIYLCLSMILSLISHT